jgi:serine/threonine protein kinase
MSELVVIKNIFDTSAAEREIDMLERIPRLNIPYCIRYKDIITLPKSSKRLIVFPYLQKLDISELNLIRIAGIFRQLMTALSELHKHRIAHLDITPSNIMLDEANGNSVVLIGKEVGWFAYTDIHYYLCLILVCLLFLDFGFSRPFSGSILDQEGNSFIVDAARNGSGAIGTVLSPSTEKADVVDDIDLDYFPKHGTVGYVAPELFYGQGKNGSCDVFSAGVILGQCLENYVHYQSLEILGGKLVGPEKIEMIWR